LNLKPFVCHTSAKYYRGAAPQQACNEKCSLFFPLLNLSWRNSRMNDPLSPVFSIKDFHPLLTLFTLKPISPAFATLTKSTPGILPPSSPPNPNTDVRHYFHCSVQGLLPASVVKRGEWFSS
jgi:hypothetical protein